MPLFDAETDLGLIAPFIVSMSTNLSWSVVALAESETDEKIKSSAKRKPIRRDFIASEFTD